jgi:hypothetical protein
MFSNDYVVVGEKDCRSGANPRECQVRKSDPFRNLFYVDNRTVDYIRQDHINIDIGNIFPDDDYYIYDIAIDDRIITLKTLRNEYSAGIWGCGIPSLANLDVQRVYTVTYNGRWNFSAPVMMDSVKYSAYCSSDDKSSFDWTD